MYFGGVKLLSADYIKREADEIASRTGRYIPPYRMANLMKTAQRVTDLMVRADVAMTYEEIQLVLGIVEVAVSKAVGRDES